MVFQVFHEPWFDEAQAWLIARDSSYHDILLLRPHYEGHPPLWTLLLSIPAKIGTPYEIGMKSVQFLTAALMVSLLTLGSPFLPITTILLPFTYFICYQSGVISRPYALVTSLVLLVAMTWRSRDVHPWRLVTVLSLLCASSTYGIALSLGFALVWILRAIRVESWRSVFRGPRTRLVSWATLLFVGMACSWTVMPVSGTNATQSSLSAATLLKRFSLMWLVAPAETSFTTEGTDDANFLSDFSWSSIGICAALSLAMWAVLLYVTHRRRCTDLLLLPYLTFSLTATVYFSGHHLGIVLAFFIAVVWICLKERPWEPDDVPHAVRQWIHDHVDRSVRWDMPAVGRLVRDAVIILLLCPSLCWNFLSVVYDIRYDYSGSRDMATFLSRNHLDEVRIVSTWNHPDPTDPKQHMLPGTTNDTHYYSWAIITANPYFTHNLLSCAYQGYTFLSNDVPTQKQADAEIAACGKGKEPEIVVGTNGEFYLTKLGYNPQDYRRYVVSTAWKTWKSSRTYSTSVIYVRNDIYATLPSSLTNLR